MAMVDVVVAARNAQASVARTVASVLAEAEVASVTVVDDASTDATADAASGADDGSGRLRVMVLPTNVGPAAARNIAWRQGCAEWVAVVDADDHVLPGRFARLLALAPCADLIADDLLVVEPGSGEPPRPMFLSPTAVPLTARAFIAGNISHGARRRRDLGYIKPLVRRSLLREPPFREELRLGEDYELYARLLLAGARGWLMPAAGYVYTVAPGSLSGTHGAGDLRALRDADCGLMRLPGVSPPLRALLARHYRSVDARLQWRRLIAAVKARDWRAAIATFGRSPPVTWFLLARLIEQGRARLTRRWGRGTG